MLKNLDVVDIVLIGSCALSLIFLGLQTPLHIPDSSIKVFSEIALGTVLFFTGKKSPTIL